MSSLKSFSDARFQLQHVYTLTPYVGLLAWDAGDLCTPQLREQQHGLPGFHSHLEVTLESMYNALYLDRTVNASRWGLGSVPEGRDEQLCNVVDYLRNVNSPTGPPTLRHTYLLTLVNRIWRDAARLTGMAYTLTRSHIELVDCLVRANNRHSTAGAWLKWWDGHSAGWWPPSVFGAREGAAAFSMRTGKDEINDWCMESLLKILSFVETHNIHTQNAADHLDKLKVALRRGSSSYGSPRQYFSMLSNRYDSLKNISRAWTEDLKRQQYRGQQSWKLEV